MIGKLNIEQCQAIADALRHLLEPNHTDRLTGGYINDYLVAIEDYEDYLIDQLEQAEQSNLNYRRVFGQPNE